MTDTTSAAPSWAVLSISDLHWNVGARLPDGSPNPLEDFKSDRQFARMLRRFQASFPAETKLTLVIGGDWIDCMTIDVGGRWRAVPTEEAGLDQVRRALFGHPEAVAALRDWLARPDSEIVVIPGNHDPQFHWGSVQEMTRSLIAPEGAGTRLRFQREARFPGGVVIVHGHEYDRWCRPPPEELTIVDTKVANRQLLVVGVLWALASYLVGIRPLKRLLAGPDDWTAGGLTLAALGFIPYLLIWNWLWSQFYFRFRAGVEKILNLPYSYYLHAGLGMLIKRFAQRFEVKALTWISRMQDHGPIWLLTLAFDWHYALVIVPMLLGHAIYYLCFVPRKVVRLVATVRALIGNLANTMHEDRVEEDAKRWLRDRPWIRFLIYGHTHKAGSRDLDVDGRPVSTHNTGTGIVQVVMRLPEVRCRTRFRSVEAFFRRIAHHWRHAARTAILFTIVHLTVVAGLQILDGWLASTTFSTLNPFLSAAAALLLLLRQSYTHYAAEERVELTPAVIKGWADGRVEVVLEQDVPEKDDLLPYPQPVGVYR
jgi:hypothetical protein